MDYQEFDPAAPLASHVSRYWGLAAGTSVPRHHPWQLRPDGGVTIFSQRGASGAAGDSGASAT